MLRSQFETVDAGWALSQKSTGFIHNKNGSIFKQNVWGQDILFDHSCFLMS